MASQYKIASDGLRARIAGPRTSDKLVYIEKYGRAFMTAMAPKRGSGIWDKLVYIDLLAGPGRCISREGAKEFDGSVLRALNTTPMFDHLYFCDKNRLNIAALRKRIGQSNESRVSIFHGDCNELVSKILNGLSDKTLAIALLDPAGFEVNFSTLQKLSTKRVDLIYLFPSGIGIVRNLGQFIEMKISPMEAFWDKEWRELPAAKVASGKMLTQEELDKFDRSWVKSFREKVRGLGYSYQDEDPPYFRNEHAGLLYHLLFFSKHKVGLTIWRGIRQIAPNHQRLLPFTDS
jgi:three-Cys-motif partner protein